MRLGKDQESLLERLGLAYRDYQQSMKALDDEYALRKYQAKDSIRSLVKTAKDAGIPVRRIHLALGMNQVGQLTAFLGRPQRLDDALNPASAFTLPDEPAPGRTEQNRYEIAINGGRGVNATIKDTHGNTYKTSILTEVSGGTLIYPADYAASPDAADITAYLHRKYNNVEEF